MNIPEISKLYTETQCLNYASSRVKGDSLVNHALDCRLSREEQWTRKQSTVVKSQLTYQKSLNMTVPHYDHEDPPTSSLTEIKDQIKVQVKVDFEEKWRSHVEQLIVQGSFLKLLEHHQTNATWQ